MALKYGLTYAAYVESDKRKVDTADLKMAILRTQLGLGRLFKDYINSLYLW